MNTSSPNLVVEEWVNEIERKLERKKKKNKPSIFYVLVLTLIESECEQEDLGMVGSLPPDLVKRTAQIKHTVPGDGIISLIP